jgi:antirestriction protein ArdC
MRTDIYERITNQIVSELEKGVRPWLKPWNAEHAAGRQEDQRHPVRITRPLRANGIPYRGINVLMLWSAALDKGYAAPIWITFKQALELNAHVRKGEQGSLVVYADKIIRTETDTDTGEESEHAIPFMKGYTVFNVEQIDGLLAHYYAKPAQRVEAVQRIAHAEKFFAATGATVRHGGTMAYYSVTHD